MVRLVERSSRQTYEYSRLYGVGRRLREHSSSMLCEVHAILNAVSLICQSGVNVVIICDSKPALQPLSAGQPTHLGLGNCPANPFRLELTERSWSLCKIYLDTLSRRNTP